jgi:hypothetical protein
VTGDARWWCSATRKEVTGSWFEWVNWSGGSGGVGLAYSENGKEIKKIRLGCMRLLGGKQFWVAEKKLKGFHNFCLNIFEFEIKV